MSPRRRAGTGRAPASRRTSLRAHSQTRAHDVLRHRRRAVWSGLGKGLLTVLLGLGITLVVLLRLEVDLAPSLLLVVTLGAPAPVFVVLGALAWRKARRDDEIHHRFQKAPSLPLRLVRDHDDVWIEGKLRCPRPLRPPEAVTHCSWYHLVIKERRGSGKHSHWVTVRDETRGATIWVTDAMREIEVDLHDAMIDYPLVREQSSAGRKKTLRYLPAHGRVSACGLARYRREALGEQHASRRDESLQKWLHKHRQSQDREEQKDARRGRRSRLAALRRARSGRDRSRMRRPAPKDPWHLESLDDLHGVPADRRLLLAHSPAMPLLVTPLTRPHWHDRSEADELATSVRADVLLGVGIPSTVWALGVWLGWWAIAFVPGALIGLLVMLAVVLPSKIIGLHNRFVMYRQRIPSARADLAVDLKMRAELLPQLESVVRAAARHEADLLAQLAALRAGAARDGDVRAALLTLREAHPTLSAEPNFALLADDITALEEKIAFGRAFLSDSITEYNTTVGRFPHMLLARATGFSSEPLPDHDGRPEGATRGE